MYLFVEDSFFDLSGGSILYHIRQIALLKHQSYNHMTIITYIVTLILRIQILQSKNKKDMISRDCIFLVLYFNFASHFATV